VYSLSLTYILGWILEARSFAGSLISKLSGLGVMLIAVGDSSFLSFPEGNDLLLVILSTGRTWEHMAYYVVMTIVGSILGCLLLYTVGRRGGSPLLRRRFSQEKIDRAEGLYKKYGLLTIAIPSILPPPMPFKIFVLSAGVFRVKIGEFITAVAIGRTIRYSTWGVLGVLYGDSAKDFIQQNLRTVGVFLVGLLLVATTGVIFFLIYRKRTKRRESV